MKEGLTGRADPVAEKPLVWCIEKLGLQTADWWADLETKFIRVTTAVLGRERAEAEFAAALTALERPVAFVRAMAQIGRT